MVACGEGVSGGCKSGQEAIKRPCIISSRYYTPGIFCILFLNFYVGIVSTFHASFFYQNCGVCVMKAFVGFRVYFTWVIILALAWFQALLAILESPMNKAGKLKGLYIHIEKNVFIQINPHIRLPRTVKRFCGLMGKCRVPVLLYRNVSLLLKFLEVTCMSKLETGIIWLDLHEVCILVSVDMKNLIPSKYIYIHSGLLMVCSAVATKACHSNNKWP